MKSMRSCGLLAALACATSAGADLCQPHTVVDLYWACDDPGVVERSTIFLTAVCACYQTFGENITSRFYQADGPQSQVLSCPIGDFNFDGVCDTGDVAVCLASAPGGDLQLGGWAYAEAEVNSPTGPGDLYIRTGTTQFLGGYASAVAIVNEIDGGCPGNLDIVGTMELPTISAAGIIRKALYVGGEWVFAFVAPCGYRSDTLSINPATGEFMVVGGARTGARGGFQLEIIEFDDHTYDLSGDGRFNQADIDLMLGRIGSTDEGDIGRFDRDFDGAITPTDIDLFQDLLDAGTGSGEFGDANGDGFVTCVELDHAQSLVGTELCDAGYVIEYDDDLDGVIDAADISALAAVARPRADLDGSGAVDGGDNAAILAAWGTNDPAADLNGSGVVDAFDLADLLAAWGQTCD